MHFCAFLAGTGPRYTKCSIYTMKTKLNFRNVAENACSDITKMILTMDYNTTFVAAAAA